MKLSARWLMPPLLLLLFGAGGVMIDRSRSEQRSVLSGSFESQPTQVASRTGGRVRRIVAPEGKAVAAGELLIELEAGPGQADATALQHKAREARARLREVEVGPRSEDVRHQQAVVEEMRAQAERTRNGSRPAEVGAARSRYQQALANYTKARKGPRQEEVERLAAAVDQVRARTRFAKADFERFRSLYKEGALSQQGLEKAQTDYEAAVAAQTEAEKSYLQAQRGNRIEDIETARAEMEAASQQLLLLEEGSRPEDIRIAGARLTQAQAQLDSLRNGSRPEEVAQATAAAQAAEMSARSARDKVTERSVKAPRAGVVERVLVAVGDLVEANAPLVRMTDPGDVWLRVYLPQNQLSKVEVGDSAEVQVDGVETRIGCVVDTIATQGEFTPANLQTPGDRGTQVFGVRLRLAKPDSRIKPGMSATVKSLGRWAGETK